MEASPLEQPLELSALRVAQPPLEVVVEAGLRLLGGVTALLPLLPVFAVAHVAFNRFRFTGSLKGYVGLVTKTLYDR